MNKPQEHFGNVEGVTYFAGSGQLGTSVCIMGSIHGNERIGAAVLEELKPILASADLRCDVYLILGNPLAYRQDVRFVDADMNRLFGEGRDMEAMSEKKVNENNYEEKRAEEIKTILAKCDYLLDIHSTIKPSVPFVYCEADSTHTALAALMGTRYIVSPGFDFRPADLISSADNYVDRCMGIGITYESGWHKDTLATHEVLGRAQLFLQKIGACDFGLSEPEKPVSAQQLLIYNHVIPASTAFTFERDFSNFDTVVAGEVIGSDGGKEISAERDSFIIFPKKDIQQGKIACYLAHVS